MPRFREAQKVGAGKSLSYPAVLKVRWILRAFGAQDDHTYYLAPILRDYNSLDLVGCGSLFIYFFFFQYMKFIVKLVSIQHPVLIPKGALLNTHHPPVPPSHPPSTLSLFSVFNSLLCFGSLPLSPLFFFSFPSPMGFC